MGIISIKFKAMKKLLHTCPDLFKILFILQFAVCNLQLATAQNLISNQSFEDTLGCPTAFSMIYVATGWSSAKGTPDYFHACDSNMASPFGPDTGQVAVPQNALGYQNAATGNAYAGFFIHPSYLSQNEREWIKRMLNTPLTIGSKYYISFKVSLADSVTCASNNIGVLFSTVSLYYSIQAPLNNFTHFNNTMIIEDTTNWTTVQGSFIADSSYNYMMIGNFYDLSLTDSIFYPDRPPMHDWDSSICYAYYYIDDISVVADTTTDILEDILQYKIVIFPNPTNDKIIIELENTSEANIIIYNSLGQPVFQQSILGKDITIDLSSYPDGMYLIQAQQNNKFFNKKITLIK